MLRSKHEQRGHFGWKRIIILLWLIAPGCASSGGTQHGSHSPWAEASSGGFLNALGSWREANQTATGTN